jgi:predicted nucleic acid-binding Zn ribbon protein
MTTKLSPPKWRTTTPPVPQSPTRDTYVTATTCPVCATPLNGRTDQRYCTPACRQTAYRRRTQNPTPWPPTPPTLPPRRSRREHTVYECSDCEQRLLGQQWCPDCQRPARRLGPGAECPACGDPITISDLTVMPPMK